jgi:hypothetical protein
MNTVVRTSNLARYNVRSGHAKLAQQKQIETQEICNIYETFLQLYRVPPPVGKDQIFLFYYNFHYLQTGMWTFRCLLNT